MLRLDIGNRKPKPWQLVLPSRRRHPLRSAMDIQQKHRHPQQHASRPPWSKQSGILRMIPTSRGRGHAKPNRRLLTRGGEGGCFNYQHHMAGCRCYHQELSHEAYASNCLRHSCWCQLTCSVDTCRCRQRQMRPSVSIAAWPELIVYPLDSKYIQKFQSFFIQLAKIEKII